MIHEIASLSVKPERIDSFKRAFENVAPLLARARGYRGHQLLQGVETPSHFNLIVQWQTLEDHTQGFEPSGDHQAFMAGLQDHLAAEPTVHHGRDALLPPD